MTSNEPVYYLLVVLLLQLITSFVLIQLARSDGEKPEDWRSDNWGALVLLSFLFPLAWTHIIVHDVWPWLGSWLVKERQWRTREDD